MFLLSFFNVGFLLFFVTFCHFSSLFVHFCHFLSLFVHFHHFFPLFITFHSLFPLFPSPFLGLDDFFAPLDITLRTKPKPNAVKQEIDKNDEQIRSALRAAFALSKLEGEVTAGSRLSVFVEGIRGDVELGGRWEGIRAEAEKEMAVEAMDIS